MVRPRRTGDRVGNSSLGSELGPHVDPSRQRSGAATGVTPHIQFSFGVHPAESAFANSTTSERDLCRRCDPLIGRWLPRVGLETALLGPPPLANSAAVASRFGASPGVGDGIGALGLRLAN